METVSEYRARMKGCPQFGHFKLRPVWEPGARDVAGFCRDEVVRQFHDPRVESDGGKRVRWMLSGWDYAREASLTRKPTLRDVEVIGRLVEVEKNEVGFRFVDVYIGSRKGAPPGLIPQLVFELTSPEVLALARSNLGGGDPLILKRLTRENFADDCRRLIKNADDWYLAFEWVHPFEDGNGRSGKILHNWLNGTLDDPVLVPDYFGGKNP